MSETVETFIIQIVKKDNEQTRNMKTESLLKSVLERGRLIDVIGITASNKKTEQKSN